MQTGPKAVYYCTLYRVRVYFTELFAESRNHANTHIRYGVHTRACHGGLEIGKPSQRQRAAAPKRSRGTSSPAFHRRPRVRAIERAGPRCSQARGRGRKSRVAESPPRVLLPSSLRSHSIKRRRARACSRTQTQLRCPLQLGNSPPSPAPAPPPPRPPPKS